MFGTGNRDSAWRQESCDPPAAFSARGRISLEPPREREREREREEEPEGVPLESRELRINP